MIQFNATFVLVNFSRTYPLLPAAIPMVNICPVGFFIGLFKGHRFIMLNQVVSDVYIFAL